MRDTEDIKEMEVHSQGMTMSRDDWHRVTGFRCCHLEPVLDFMTFFHDFITDGYVMKNDVYK